MSRMYDYLLPSVNFMGPGCLKVIGERAKMLGGKKVLVVTDKFLRNQANGAVEQTINYLTQAGLEVAIYDGTEPNPKDTNVAEGLKNI